MSDVKKLTSEICLTPFVLSGVPMEVMGLMLGEFVDEYTVRVIDVFAMPQSGTGVSVEAVDPVFQVITVRRNSFGSGYRKFYRSIIVVFVAYEIWSRFHFGLI